MILPRDYFDRPTLEVARSLVGKYLVRDQGSGLIVGRIIEVEAYIGTEDKACHASKGKDGTYRRAVWSAGTCLCLPLLRDV